MLPESAVHAVCECWRRGTNIQHIQRIPDHARLLRSVRPSEFAAGKPSASAFNDREGKPSVDLERNTCGACRCFTRRIEQARKGPDQLVLQIAVDRLRQLHVPIYNARRIKTGSRAFDVTHEPRGLADDGGPNLAHCLITHYPTAEKSQFRRVKESLCRIAVLHPADVGKIRSAPP